jgi:di/tricarboxylate transporter
VSWQILFVYALIAGAIALFYTGRLRLDVTAGLVILALALSGILSPAEAIAGFGSPLVLMIAGLFVVSEGLHRTGVAAWAGTHMARLGRGNETHLIVLLMPVVALLSAFMSSTGVVALFIPVAMSLAREAGVSPSRLLLPLAFASLIGGMLTLVGTPPNLAASQALVGAGLQGFGFFDFTPIGAVILLAGIAYMLTLGRRLLPEPTEAQTEGRQRRLDEMAERYGIENRLHRLRVQPGSLLIDRTAGEVGLRRHYGITVVAVERRGGLLGTLMPALAETRLNANDILIVAARTEALDQHGDALQLADVGFPEDLQRRFRSEFGLAEVLVVPDSPLVDRTIREANFRRRQRFNVLSLRRGDQPMPMDFSTTRLQTGDLLLVIGAWDDLVALGGPRQDVVLLELPEEVAERTWHANQAPWAVLIVLGMLLLMSFQLVPNLVAVMLAAAGMVLTRCVQMEEAYSAMNWQTLVLIAGMLPLAQALEVTGGSQLLVGGLSAALHDLGPRSMLAALFIMTSVFSQFISNTATTVLIAPIALGLALDLGLSPAPFLMTIAIAASTAFATPVASPVNTLILGPGNYRFGDFVRLGVPLQIIALIITVVLVPIVFPL